MPARKTLPDFASDDDAELFVASTDLSGYDLASFIVAPLRFANAGERTLSIREGLLRDIEQQAEREGVTTETYVERALESALRSAAA